MLYMDLLKQTNKLSNLINNKFIRIWIYTYLKLRLFFYLTIKIESLDSEKAFDKQWS